MHCAKSKQTTLTLDHVLDVRAHRSDGGQLLLGAEPLLDLERLGGGHLDVQREMLEVALQHTARSLDGDHTRLDRSLDSLGNLHELISIDGLHFAATADEKRENQNFIIIQFTGRPNLTTRNTANEFHTHTQTYTLPEWQQQQSHKQRSPTRQ